MIRTHGETYLLGAGEWPLRPGRRPASSEAGGLLGGLGQPLEAEEPSARRLRPRSRRLIRPRRVDMSRASSAPRSRPPGPDPDQRASCAPPAARAPPEHRGQPGIQASSPWSRGSVTRPLPQLGARRSAAPPRRRWRGRRSRCRSARPRRGAARVEPSASDGVLPSPARTTPVAASRARSDAPARGLVRLRGTPPASPPSGRRPAPGPVPRSARRADLCERAASRGERRPRPPPLEARAKHEFAAQHRDRVVEPRQLRSRVPALSSAVAGADQAGQLAGRRGGEPASSGPSPSTPSGRQAPPPPRSGRPRPGARGASSRA